MKLQHELPPLAFYIPIHLRGMLVHLSAPFVDERLMDIAAWRPTRIPNFLVYAERGRIAQTLGLTPFLAQAHLRPHAPFIFLVMHAE